MKAPQVTTIALTLPATIWNVLPIEERPELTLLDWAIFELQMAHSPVRTRHFAGYTVTDREGRASSAILEFDPARMIGITESSRVYHLRGRPGLTGDGAYVWGRWLKLSKATGVVDITKSVLA